MSDPQNLAIDWTALEAAFENHSPEVKSYFDRQSGTVETMLGKDVDSGRHNELREQPDRHVFIEPVPSREQYRIMERFISTVPYPRLAAQLADAIVGKGAFRRFKDCIGQHVEERKRWFAFRDVLVHQHILDWCKEQRLEFETPVEWSLELPDAPDPEEQPVQMPPEEERPETTELKRYLKSWARAHGEEYQYLFGPAAFDRLAEDLSHEFNLFRRR